MCPLCRLQSAGKLINDDDQKQGDAHDIQYGKCHFILGTIQSLNIQGDFLQGR